MTKNTYIKGPFVNNQELKVMKTSTLEVRENLSVEIFLGCFMYILRIIRSTNIIIGNVNLLE
jgi:hypothetical protein